MFYTLENKLIKISVHAHGAELHSINGKKSNTEFLWNAQPEHWGYHAPILFPIIGRLKNDQLMVDGKGYSIGKHGFARVSDFTVVEQSNESITFLLCSNEELMVMYPFPFVLKVKYSLNENEVIVDYSVENSGNGNLFFSIGAHPALMCPLEANEAFTDYYLEFNKKETKDLACITPDGYISRETKPFLRNESTIPLNYELFLNDALVFNQLESHVISLKSVHHNKYVEVDFSGFPSLGIWTKNNAPFICIEPWFGHGDFIDFKGSFSEKAGIICLEKGKIFTCRHKIRIFE